MNKLYLLVPAVFDLLTSTMHYIALNFISASAYQMIKGGTIITTFIFSITFLKYPFLRRQLLGSGLALIGIIAVGLANVLFTTQTYSETNTVTFLFYLAIVDCWIFSYDPFPLYKWIFFRVLTKINGKISFATSGSCRIWRAFWIFNISCSHTSPLLHSLLFWPRCVRI